MDERALIARIEELEKGARGSRAAMLVMAAVIGGGLLIAAAENGPGQTTVSDVVEAREIVVKDRGGVVRARLTADESAGAQLVLEGPSGGNIRMEGGSGSDHAPMITLSGRRSVATLVAHPELAQLKVMTPRGQAEVDGGSGASVMLTAENEFAELTSVQGDQRLQFGHCPSVKVCPDLAEMALRLQAGSPSLTGQNAKGAPSFRLPARKGQ